MAGFNWLDQWKDVGRKNGHSVFDLQKRMVFSLPNGLIVPIKFIETVPDDHFQIDIKGLMRTETMNTAAFFDGKAVFDVFFVPYKQLWHNFNQFVVQKHDRHGSTLKSSLFAPNIELAKIIKYVGCCYMYSVGANGVTKQKYLTDIHGVDWCFNICRLLQHAKILNLWPLLAYIDYCKANSETVDLTPFYTPFVDRYVNLWRPLAYQHIFYDFYRNKYYDEFPEYQLDGVTPSDPGTGTGTTGTSNWIDLFNVDDISCASLATSHLSFQNLTNYPTDFAGVMTSPNHGKLTAINRFFNIFGLHYCQYRKDLFTSLLPSTQFGAVSSLDFSGQFTITDGETETGTDAGRWADASTGSGTTAFDPLYLDDTQVVAGSVQSSAADVVHTHTISLENTQGELSLPNAIDVLSFRRAELLQSWKQNALRAGNMVDANFRSHYGVEPYYEDDNNVKFLGTFTANLNINPVTAQASTGAEVNGKVGDLAAIGVGSVSGNTIDFQCRDFGTIVVCARFQSEVFYSANGIDKQNTMLEPFDYFTPEFENAGLESVPAWQQSTGISADDSLDKSLGFAPPYTCYKTDIDEVFDQFADMAIIQGDSSDPFSFFFKGNMYAWTAKRSDFVLHQMYPEFNPDFYTASLPISRFYQSPYVTDSLFGVNYDGRNCPFSFSVVIDVKPVRPMSVLGIPIFG